MSVEYSAVGALSLALLHNWEPERPFVIISVYIDESGIHGPSAMVMGCIVGNVRQWEVFDEKFSKHLAVNNLTYYHSKRLHHSSGHEFRGWDDYKKFEFLQTAAEITRDHTMFGVTGVLGYDDYKRYYIANERPPEFPLDSMYGLCFRFCLLRIVDLLLYRLGDPDELEVHFVLEDGHKNFGDAQRIFSLMKNSGPTRLRRLLKTITAAGKKDFPGIQAADAGAYNILRSERERDTSPSMINIPAQQKMYELPTIHG
jgi:uncharacterized protein DUF3800